MRTSTVRRLVAVLCLAGGSGLVATLPATPAGATRGGYPPPTRKGPHVMFKTPPGQSPQTAAPANAQLSYFGGRVMSNAVVEDVYYGSGTYESGVAAGGQMPSFFNAVGSSAYFDWLTEYNTTRTAQNGQPGTNQTIGHSSFLAETTISPSGNNNQQTIDDSNIQSELAAQLTSGGLPAPQTDGHGNVNTLYGLYFPQGKKLTSSSGTGGVQWCAYHGTITWNGLSVPYMVLPDFADTTQPGISYQGGCGGDKSTFNNFTSVASHEWAESVTDAEVGLASSIGPPLAWYDSNNGEIGDICNAQQGPIVGWVVQQLWSNQANACIVQKAANNDFSISASPSSLSVAQRTTGTTTINTATTTGSAQTVSLSASGLPGLDAL